MLQLLGAFLSKHFMLLSLSLLQAEDNWNFVSMFFVEFFVGVSMLVVVILLLAFRFKEIKECWEVHIRIRFYFGLTVIATVVNLALGICGTVYVAQETKS